MLSICIPTFNRCEILDNTLFSLFSNPDFDENQIEVIVSDNCSTDRTSEIVLKYPLVFYYKNEENLGDKNFWIVLTYATGKYIKLFNDTLSFNKFRLKGMLDKIEENLGNGCNLFFIKNNFLSSDRSVIVNSSDTFLSNVSFYSTWIANFGCWKQDFNSIVYNDYYASLQLIQVDWAYRIVGNSKVSVIFFDDFFEVQVVRKKGGYNLFEVFVINYLDMIKIQNVSRFNYEIEKYRLMKFFIYSWLVSFFVVEVREDSYERQGVVKILFRKYWYEPYFYAMIFIFFAKSVKYKFGNLWV